jgi:hypothetical protein
MVSATIIFPDELQEESVGKLTGADARSLATNISPAGCFTAVVREVKFSAVSVLYRATSGAG